MNKMETKNLKKLSNSRGTVIRINVFTIIATILSFIAFIPIAIITAYFIFSSLGKEELLLGLFESWNMQGFSNFFIDKINASSQKDIYQAYFLFTAFSFIISLILLIKSCMIFIANASRKRFNRRKRIKHLKKKYKQLINPHRGNGLLFFIHLLSVFALAAYYIVLHITVFKDIVNINDIIKNIWTISLPFLIIILPFIIDYWKSVKNENNLTAHEAQQYENLLKHSSKTPLKLFTPYWGYFLGLSLQVYVFVFCADETLAPILNIIIEAIERWVTGHLFASDVLKLESKAWQGITEDYEEIVDIQKDTIDIQNDRISHLESDRYDHTENEIFWLGETRSLYSQIPENTKSFVAEYSEKGWKEEYLDDPEAFYFG